MLKRVFNSATDWLDRKSPTVIALAALLFVPNHEFFDFQANIYDLQTKVRYLSSQKQEDRHSLPITVVLIDDEAIRTDVTHLLQPPSPISSRYLAKVVDRISAQRPRVIAIDFLLDRPSRERGGHRDLTRTLGAAMQSGVPIVLAARVVDSGLTEYPVLPVPDVLRSTPGKNSAAWNKVLVGHVNLLKSVSDGVVRRATAATPIAQDALEDYLRAASRENLEHIYLDGGEMLCLSFAVQIVRALTPNVQAELDAMTRALLAKGDVEIDFSTPAPEIQVTSAALLFDTDALVNLNDRVVVIGAGYSGGEDYHYTPLASKSYLVSQWTAMGALVGPAPGALVHAYAARTWYTLHHGGEYIRRIDSLPVIASGAVILLALYICALPFKQGQAAEVAGLLALVVYVLISLLLFHNRLIYLPVVKPVVVLSAAIVLLRSYRRRKL